MKLGFSRQTFEKCSNVKFHENSKCWRRVFPRRQKARHDETNSRCAKYIKSTWKDVQWFIFLNEAFSSVRKIAKQRLLPSSCLSISPPVYLFAWNNSAPTGGIFVKLDIWMFFENLLKKFQFSLKPDRKKGYFTWRPKYIFGHMPLISS